MGQQARKDNSMTDELKKRMARLREIAPRLNNTTDQASKLVAMVEKFLAEELRIGLGAKTSEFNAWDEGNTEDGESRRTIQNLAFGRVGAQYRIHVITETGILDAARCWQETTQRVETLWPSCSRETKLKAFEKLPELLDAIIASAENLAKTADETASQVEEMIGDSLEGAPIPELAPRMLTCQSCGEQAKLLNIGSSHWAACTDCEMKWRLGANLLPSWREETHEDWKRNAALLASLTEEEM
jgi:hypothetical protein